jgi:hypothetical protein
MKRLLALFAIIAAVLVPIAVNAANNLFPNPDFEHNWVVFNTKATVPTEWTPRLDNYDYIGPSADVVYHGQSALHVISSAKSGAQILNSIGVQVQPGVVYKIGYWVYVKEGGIRFSVVDNTAKRYYPKFNNHHYAEEFSLGEWQYGEIEFEAPEGCFELRLSLVQPTDRAVARAEAFIDMITVYGPDNDVETALKEAAVPTIYQEVVKRGEPSDWKPANQNPPTFRWPISNSPTYELQYALQPDFSDAETITELDRTFYRPSGPLPPGDYYWRYRASNGQWSEPLTFSITADLPEGFTYDWEQALSLIPTKHPRLWVRPETVSALVQNAQAGLNRYTLTSWRAQALTYVGQELLLAKHTPRLAPTNYNQRVQQSQSALADSQQTMQPAGELAFLYLLTGNKVLADEAIRRVMVATELDAAGYTAPTVNDYANAEIMRNSAMVYDYMYDILTPEQKDAIRSMLVTRLKMVYQDYRPKREQEVYHSHTWQHIMIDFFTASLAIYGEVPEAAEWLEWSLNMILAFYPWWGSVDGSSGGSAAYALGPNLLHYSHLTAELIKAATGIEFMDHPWFAANPYYVIYAYPPRGLRSQFGDYRQQSKPGSQLYMPMVRYAMRYQNPYAQAYANEIGGLPGIIESYMLYFLTPLAGMPAPRPLSELPKARAFPDAGVVFMHSNIADTADNVMFEFRSSPLGSFGHGHADQNSFNIIAFNEMLALDSGYYIAYGDTHHYGWTVTTAAHNAVLIDGKGQPSRNMDAYGRLTAFFTGSAFHYTVGSAASAYRNTPVNTFLRHVLWIEPYAYVIFDQIDADEPVTTQWLLHSLEQMDIEQERRWAHIQRGPARLSAYLAFPTTGELTQTDQFAVPIPETVLRGSAGDYPNQWHMTAHSPASQKEHRWLTALFVGKNSTNAPAVRRAGGENWYGLAWQNAGFDVTLGFSSATEATTMEMDGLSATAKVAALRSQSELVWSLFSVDCVELVLAGERVLQTNKPVTLEMSRQPDAVVLRYQADTDVQAHIAYPSAPQAVIINEQEVGIQWHEDSKQLSLTLPAGEHVVTIQGAM